MEGLEDRETGQSRDVSILNGTRPDGPVRVDTAMRTAAHEYTGPASPHAFPELGSAAWWRKVKGLASRA